MCVCVCVLFDFRQFVFFYSGNSSTYFKVCVDLCKKKTGIRSRQSERKRFGFLKEERNSVVIHR